MKRFILYYSNSHMEQTDVLNPQFDHLIKIRVLNFVIDTVDEVCYGTSTEGKIVKIFIPTPDPVPAPPPEASAPVIDEKLVIEDNRIPVES